MNEKKAKKIRKEARLFSQGLPYVEYSDYMKPIFHNGKKIIAGTPRRMIKDCIRHTYKQLKKAEIICSIAI